MGAGRLHNNNNNNNEKSKTAAERCERERKKEKRGPRLGRAADENNLNTVC